jgi:hypothetical protein
LNTPGTQSCQRDDATLHGLRKIGQAMNANNLDVLTKLNDDCIQSVQAARQDRGRP